MRRAVTPIIAIVLLVLMTVGASGLAFVWINGVSSSIQETTGASITNNPGSDCNRLNIISMRGTGVVVQNVGCEEVDSVNVLINDEITSYNLDDPLAPGGVTTITYSPLAANDGSCVTVLLSNGAYSESCVSASDATVEAGYLGGSAWFSGCSLGVDVVNLDNNIVFDLSDNLVCSCESSPEDNYFSNPSFETGDTTGWNIENNEPENGKFVEVTSVKANSGTYSINVSNFNESLDRMPTFGNQVPLSDDVSFSINSYDNGIDMSFSILAITVDPEGERYELYYLMYYNLIEPYGCGQMGPNTIFNCLNSSNGYDLIDNSWNDIMVHPVTDFLSYGIDVSSYSEMSMNFIVGNQSIAYFDDIFSNLILDGFVCDTSNLDGIADGECNSGSCVPVSVDDNQAFCVNPNVWFTGTVTGDNGDCCGDDGVLDDFYNTTHICDNGEFRELDPDESIYLCNQQYSTWFTGTISYNWLSGSDGILRSPCCGDDSELDDFLNDTMVCENGIPRDLTDDESSSICAGNGYVFFSGSVTGSNGYCCGDDGSSDNFFNSTAWCCESNDYYDCSDNGIGEKFCSCSGSSIIDTCGDNICNGYENNAVCSYDCPIWHGYEFISDSPSVYSLPSHTTCDGSNVYVAWKEYEGGAYLRRSTNNGVSWSNNISLDSVNTAPFMFTNESALFIVYDNMIKRSYDLGDTWDTPTVMISEGSVADAINSDSNIYAVVIESNGTANNALFTKSDDYGYTWSENITLKDNCDSIGTHLVTQDSNLYFLYNNYNESSNKYDIFLMNSSDEGVTWSDARNVTDISDSLTMSRGNIGLEGNNVHVIYSYNSGTYYKKSVDGGLNWSDQVLLSSVDTYWGSVILVNGSKVNVLLTNGNVELVRSIDSGSNWFYDNDEGLSYNISNHRYPSASMCANNIHFFVSGNHVSNPAISNDEVYYSRYGP